MRAERACDRIRVELSAGLDGEIDAATARTLDEHLESCESCRRYLDGLITVRRALRAAPAEDVPDLAPAIMQAVTLEGPRRRARDEWFTRVRVASIAAAAAALLLIGTSIPWVDDQPESAGAAEIVAEVRSAARTLDAYRASFQITERGWHERVPVRRFVAEIEFAAPERIAVSIVDRTRYPAPGRWPANDVKLVADGNNWWLREPTSCPAEALPGCAQPSRVEERAIVRRQPFDGSSSLPTDVILPLQTLSSADGLEVVGREEVRGRPSLHVVLPYRLAIPLVDAFRPGGSWRAFHPSDRADIWIDSDTWFPLRVEIRAGSSEDRVAWARRHGYTDRADARLLRAEAISLVSDPSFQASTFAVPRRGIVKDGGFDPIARERVEAAAEPAFTAGLGRYRAGVTADEQTILTYVEGMTWLKVVREPFRPVASIGRLSAEEIRLSDGGYAYYEPASDTSARRTDVYGAGEHVRLESNLPRARLLEVAASLDIDGRRLARRVNGPRGSIIRRLGPRDLGQIGLRPGYLPPGYRFSAALVSRSRDGRRTVTAYYRRPEAEHDGFGIRITQARPIRLLAPSSEEFVETAVGSLVGRWSAERGELEWIDDSAYRAVAAPSFDLMTTLRIAQALE